MFSSQRELVLDERPHHLEAIDALHRKPEVQIDFIHLGERTSDAARPCLEPDSPALFRGRHVVIVAWLRRTRCRARIVN
jgi:hypothetical protein